MNAPREPRCLTATPASHCLPDGDEHPPGYIAAINFIVICRNLYNKIKTLYSLCLLGGPEFESHFWVGK